jgi:uncharacterized damage-inducible protein DinB
MSEYFDLLADYNDKANRAMFAILADLSNEQLVQDVGSHYRSILGVISHIYDADLRWLERIRKGFPELSSLDGVTSDPGAEPASPGRDFATLSAERRHVDGIFRKLAAELDGGLAGGPAAEVLKQPLVFSDSRGNSRQYILWQALVHIFNHQTHHRGQVAEILDQMEVKNDYSNIIWYIAPPN